MSCVRTKYCSNQHKIYELTLFFNFLIFQLDDGPSFFIGWKVSVRRGNVADAQIVNSWSMSSKFMNPEKKLGTITQQYLHVFCPVTSKQCTMVAQALCGRQTLAGTSLGQYQ